MANSLRNLFAALFRLRQDFGGHAPAFSVVSRIEVKYRKFAMIFLCGFIVGVGGGDFGGEQAERKTLSLITNSGTPFPAVLRPVNANVIRARIRPELPSMPDVLGVSRRTKIGLSIVQAIIVDVVGKHPIWDVDDEIVHICVFAVLIFEHRYVADGVKGGWAFAGIPFVSFQTLVILGVNNGKLAQRKRNTTKRIAEAKPAIQKDKPIEQLCQPIRDV